MKDLSCALDSAVRLAEMWRTPHIVATNQITGKFEVMSRDQWAALISHDEYSECRFVAWHFVDRLEKGPTGRFPAFSKMK